ncbi:MAG: aryl-sulfate sulfotransferase [bacterium]
MSVSSLQPSPKAYASTSKNTVTFTYPASGAISASPKTSIGFHFSLKVDSAILGESRVHATGSMSGEHLGRLVLTRDRQTLIFHPNTPFAESENVDVVLDPFSDGNVGLEKAYSLSFHVSIQAEIPKEYLNELNVTATPEAQNTFPLSGFDSISHDPPIITVLKSDNPSAGQFYLSSYKTPNNRGNTFMMVVDNTGNTIFRKRTDTTWVMDFKPQRNGTCSYFDEEQIKFYITDTRFFVPIDSIGAAHGYHTDGHELRALRNGGYALLAVNGEKYDMRKEIDCGDSNAILLTYVIQEFDSDKNLVWEWNTRDHFKLTDATKEYLCDPVIDNSHGNSLEYEGDTAVILSSRNMDEITKINRKTGEIIWRLGGKNNQFTYLNDTVPISHQHCARRLANGHITIFDNGSYHIGAKPYSRALEYEVDEVKRIATKVWEFRHSPDLHAESMGSMQRLSSGNTLIGWGQCDSVMLTEVRPDGSTALEMRMMDGKYGAYSYRAFKYTKDELSIAPVIQKSEASVVLHQNRPNPASSQTSIGFEIGETSTIRISLSDELGREVKELFSGDVQQGSYEVKIDTHLLPTGVYLYTMTSGVHTFSKKMLIIKD